MRKLLLLLPLAGCFFGAPAQPEDAGASDVTVEATVDSGAPEAAACAPADAGDLPCDVSIVFQSKCQQCHTSPPANGAPFPLLTYEDLVSPYGADMLRWQRVAEVVEPSSPLHMPPLAQPQLTTSELDTLHAWFAACAPALPERSGCDVGGNAADASPD